MKKIIASALILAVMASCSSKKEEAATETTTATPAPTENVASASNITQLTLNGDDQMKFDLSELRVPAGAQVELTLNHTGKMAKDVMGHNFVLLKQGTDLTKFSAVASNAKDTNYVPANSPDVLAASDLIGGGQSTVVRFTAPPKGSYDFICSFPGHYAMMKGKLISE